MFHDDQIPNGEIEFYPITNDEYSAVNNHGVQPRHQRFDCSACGRVTQGRVASALRRPKDNLEILWCVCSCDKLEPAVLVMDGEVMVSQSPMARVFHTASDWPANLSALYDEAAKAYSAGAYTACAMVCRKVLMACACEKGETDGKSFASYVDHLTTKVLNYPDAKTSIDAIRTIGNEATHEIKIVNQADATRAMKIVTYMLNTIYSLPAA